MDELSKLARDQFFNYFETICHYGVDTFLFVLNINKIEESFDNNFTTLLELLHVLLGDDLWDHSAVVFTFCEDKDEKIKELKKNFNTYLKKRISVKEDMALFFVSNKTLFGIDELQKFIHKKGRIESKVIKAYQQQENKSIKKEELDAWMENAFTKSLEKEFCTIL
jgi:hypothetical protein